MTKTAERRASSFGGFYVWFSSSVPPDKSGVTLDHARVETREKFASNLATAMPAGTWSIFAGVEVENGVDYVSE
jgi:hypothetical protein